VIERSNTIRLCDLNGVVLQTFSSTSSATTPAPTTTTNKNKSNKMKENIPAALCDFISVCFSAKGHYMYAVTEECVLHIFQMETGKLENVIKVTKKKKKNIFICFLDC
jgi:hypothetical protein